MQIKMKIAWLLFLPWTAAAQLRGAACPNGHVAMANPKGGTMCCNLDDEPRVCSFKTTSTGPFSCQDWVETMLGQPLLVETDGDTAKVYLFDPSSDNASVIPENLSGKLDFCIPLEDEDHTTINETSDENNEEQYDTDSEEDEEDEPDSFVSPEFNRRRLPRKPTKPKKPKARSAPARISVPRNKKGGSKKANKKPKGKAQAPPGRSANPRRKPNVPPRPNKPNPPPRNQKNPQRFRAKKTKPKKQKGSIEIMDYQDYMKQLYPPHQQQRPVNMQRRRFRLPRRRNNFRRIKLGNMNQAKSVPNNQRVYQAPPMNSMQSMKQLFNPPAKIGKHKHHNG